MLLAFMRSLPALGRALLLLYLDERSGQEMAEVLGIGASTSPPASTGSNSGCGTLSAPLAIFESIRR